MAALCGLNILLLWAGIISLAKSPPSPLYLKIINTKMTNTSIDLSWNTTSQNCQDDLPNLQGLSYDCSCFPSDQKHSNEVNKHKQANGETCHVAGLEPYTSYTCEIQPTYHNKKVRQPTVVQQRTEIGIPGDITGVMAVSEHNVIRVTCTRTNRLNGPEEQYIARLYDVSVRLKELKANNCEFEFKDLNYSSYRLEVTVFNGKFESKPKTQDVVTHQSFKGVFIMVFFAIFTITLAVAVYVTKCRKSRNDVNENVILESTAGS
ncbi:receptor-type tyrosine-protein phosphatase C-like isoform X1 [Larimichthys crocea]|uniref:receptor-type tyrosine-protein phosphatase C-like isoform X1 n=1 Tax=Larimichthys crocea TaxID=215358 RepID=UPI000F5FFA70|nr:receptor-type tyrosine-protein phosphatase C-like isoform X1 [Larimichthys crocea]